MSKRNKRKGHNRAARAQAVPPQRQVVGDSSGATAVAAARPVQPQTVPAYASGVTAPRRVTQAPTASIDIDERVPHFTGDLRRIGPDGSGDVRDHHHRLAPGALADVNPPGWLTLVALGGLVVLAGWQASTNFRLNRMVRHYRGLSAGIENQPLDQILQRIVERGASQEEALREIQAHLASLREEGQAHLQQVGVVRYNAFEDTGGDQSFAVAVLDAHGDGALINGLFHRTECRVYAKPIHEWRSTYSLSDEEEEAIRKARGAIQPETAAPSGRRRAKARPQPSRWSADAGQVARVPAP